MNNKTIAETNNFIVLDKYSNIKQDRNYYQSEKDLENELIRDLSNQGYEYRDDINTPEKLLENVRIQIQELNKIKFLDNEWDEFVKQYLDKPNDNIIDKTRKIQDDYIYDFTFNDGHIKNIYILDKVNIANNKLQVIRQFSQKGIEKNIYDVTILVNGLPLVQIELKKRGVAIREAFNQIHRYSKESFNKENSLYKYLQIFVISNGTDTRYFANTTKRNNNSFDFTMNWAISNNTLIKDLKDFTATFLEKNTLLNILIKYCVFNVENILLIMRPYQIAATERIIWKIKSSYEAKKFSTNESGGYIWHTTGSGKTLTSFKAARLATKLDFIDKVFFVVDRKDLDYQTMKEYQKFSQDSVNGSKDVKELKKNLKKEDNKIIVTTIQKLNILIKSEEDLEIYSKHVVFIFDEAHRSQFGEAQRNIRKKFKKYYQFGFTGTPIFTQNALNAETTEKVFGCRLHSYVITDAIRDEKVLKFKVDYNDIRPKFRDIEKEQDEEKLQNSEKEALLHPERIKEISQYILNNFNQKTHRLQVKANGFNAMFAVSSIDAAKKYYENLKELQKERDKPLKIATIFSYEANEKQDAAGDIPDESLETQDLKESSKEFLRNAINDYNKMFETSYGVDSKEFENYYKDLSKRVKNREVDLVIVVGMFLTGFDAPTLNTLFVDKNLKYHGLIQAFSRTNRIYDTTKTFGNIVTFRNLEQATIDAITLFGDDNNDIKNIILEKSYSEYMHGFIDNISGETKKGYLDIIKELEMRFPNYNQIETEEDKKEFVKLFGKYLRIENILQNYDEFHTLKALQNLDLNNLKDVEEFKSKYYLNDEDFNKISKIKIPSERVIQDYKSKYYDIREWYNNQKNSNKKENSIDWNNVVFEIELIKSQEYNLDYILELIFEYHKKVKDKTRLIEEVERLIHSSLENRTKEKLIIKFINQTNLDDINNKSNMISSFFEFAQIEQKKEADELIINEKLNDKNARRYINTSLNRGYASEDGTDLNDILPKMSKFGNEYLPKKTSILNKISQFVETFKNIGGKV